MTIKSFGTTLMVAATLLLAIPASPAFAQLAQKSNVTVYASPT